MNRKFNSYNEFYKFYLGEHRKATTRLFHCVGLLLGLALLVYAIVTQQWIFILLGLIAGYGGAWISHFFVEHNKPASIKYPLYSFISDYRMLFETLVGRIPLTRDL